MAFNFKHYQLHSNASQTAWCSSACKSQSQTHCNTSVVHTDIVEMISGWSFFGCQIPFRIKFVVKGNNESQSSNRN
jgi:hypothetical protein